MLTTRTPGPYTLQLSIGPLPGAEDVGTPFSIGQARHADSVVRPESGWTKLAWQSVHSYEPESDSYLPGAQAEQTAAPVIDDARPGEHAVHPSCEVRPRAEDDVPAAQLEHEYENT
jgi:hypothetical protein